MVISSPFPQIPTNTPTPATNPTGLSPPSDVFHPYLLFLSFYTVCFSITCILILPDFHHLNPPNTQVSQRNKKSKVQYRLGAPFSWPSQLSQLRISHDLTFDLTVSSEVHCCKFTSKGRITNCHLTNTTRQVWSHRVRTWSKSSHILGHSFCSAELLKVCNSQTT